MANQSPDMRRLAVVFALSKLPRSIQSDVLADGSIAGCFNLETNNPVHLSPEVVLGRDELFAAFRQAAQGTFPISLNNHLGGSIEASVSIDDVGTGIVSSGGKNWRFEHLAILLSSPERRLYALEQYLSDHTITDRDREHFREFIGQDDFPDEDVFSIVSLLASSPESFAKRFVEKLESGNIGKADILPEDIRHWEHLTAPLNRSTNLTEFIGCELANEWKTRLLEYPESAFNSIALTFASPALVPRSLFEGIDDDAMLETLEQACKFDSHFALTGAFQICADHVGRNPRFIEIGEKLLDRLFGDMQRLEIACQVFVTAFVISTAHLAEHEVLREHPPFWRRLAAASHASLVVRSSGVTEVNQDELVKWAMSVSGAPCVLSLLNDFVTEPRWRPEWISHHCLIADVFGRSLTTLLGLPKDMAPNSWRKRLDVANEWIEENHLEPFVHFPAILEGARQVVDPNLTETGMVADLFRRFSDEPSSDHFLLLSAVVHMFGFPVKFHEEALKVINGVRDQPACLDDQKIQHVLALAAHIAAQANDVALADAVAETCLEKARFAKLSQTIPVVVYRLVECAAANSNRAAARSILAQRLETLAFILDIPRMLADLNYLLESLKQVEPGMAPLLGRAIAAAKLGIHRSAAA